jgi:hypothetical protein
MYWWKGLAHQHLEITFFGSHRRMILSIDIHVFRGFIRSCNHWFVIYDVYLRFQAAFVIFMASRTTCMSQYPDGAPSGPCHTTSSNATVLAYPTSLTSELVDFETTIDPTLSTLPLSHRNWIHCRPSITITLAIPSNQSCVNFFYDKKVVPTSCGIGLFNTIPKINHIGTWPLLYST